MPLVLFGRQMLFAKLPCWMLWEGFYRWAVGFFFHPFLSKLEPDVLLTWLYSQTKNVMVSSYARNKEASQAKYISILNIYPRRSRSHSGKISVAPSNFFVNISRMNLLILSCWCDLLCSFRYLIIGAWEFALCGGYEKGSLLTSLSGDLQACRF